MRVFIGEHKDLHIMFTWHEWKFGIDLGLWKKMREEMVNAMTNFKLHD